MKDRWCSGALALCAAFFLMTNCCIAQETASENQEPIDATELVTGRWEGLWGFPANEAGQDRTLLNRGVFHLDIRPNKTFLMRVEVYKDDKGTLMVIEENEGTWAVADTYSITFSGTKCKQIMSGGKNPPLEKVDCGRIKKQNVARITTEGWHFLYGTQEARLKRKK